MASSDTSPGQATVDAVEQSGADHGYGTSQADIDAYAGAAGGAGGAAACAAVGAAAAAPLCAWIGSKVGAAIADAIQNIGAAIFGAPSQPDAGDVFNPIADRLVAALVLQSQGKPHDKAAIHALGEDGIRILAGRRGGSVLVTNPVWQRVAVYWSQQANVYGKSHSARRSGTEITWWHEEPTLAGRIIGSVASVYGNGPDDRKDISASMVYASAQTATWLEASKNASSGSSLGKLVTFGLLVFGGYEAYKHRKRIKRALSR